MSNNDNFDGKRFHSKAEGFDKPTGLPESEQQAAEWQKANKSWWERSPMRYDWQEEISAKPGDAAYFDEIDRRFFDSVRHYMPWTKRPFDNLINFETLGDKDVLEIGVGQGSHAELIAPHCRNYTGIDLTELASSMTRKRMALRGIPAEIFQMDAERMTFDDQSFDWVWSWGVIHHSANTRRIIEEIARVLKSEGRVTVMVYNKSAWKYYVMDGFIKGILFGEYFRLGSLHAVSQAQTDGAIARYYTVKQFQELVGDLFVVEKTHITGHKSDVIPLPAGRLKQWVTRILPDRLTRFLTDQLKFGSFLIADLRKRT